MPSFGSRACCEPAIQQVLRDASIVHAPDVSEPAQASLSQQREHAPDFCLLQDCLVWNAVLVRILLRQRMCKASSFRSCLEYNVYVSLP